MESGNSKQSKISLHIDPNVKPIAQPYCRVPFNLKKKVDEKNSELLELDIIEPVEGPAPWVNPVGLSSLRAGEK